MYLAIVARTLGAEQLGILVLIHAYALFFRDVASFKSWQALIRYGADYLNRSDAKQFSRLVKLTFLLDIGGAILGTLLALLLLEIAAPQAGIPSAMVAWAGFYCVSTLFSIKSTPIGILRLFDKFSVLAKAALVVPVLRTLGVIVATLYDQPLTTYIMVWFVSDMLGSLVLVWLGFTELSRHREALPVDWRISLATHTHERIWPFIWNANFHSTVNLVNSHFLILFSGFLLSPAAVAFVKVAQELAGILQKAASILSDVLYPELSKLLALKDTGTAKKLITSTMRPTFIITMVVAVILFLVSEPLLEAVGGAEYRVAGSLFRWFVVCGIVQLSLFWVEPGLYAMGRPEIVLYTRIFASAVQVGVMFFLTRTLGLAGVGIAALAAGVIIGLTNLAVFLRLLNRTKISASDT